MDEWNFSPAIIAEAQEICIGARVACHWSEAECQDQEGTVVGVVIHRRGKVEYTVHIDGDISPTDGFTHDIAGIEGGTIRLLSASPALPAFDGGEFTRVAKAKLDGLLADGWKINGYSIQKEDRLGLVTTGAFVGWYTNACEAMSAAESRVQSLEEEVKRLQRRVDMHEAAIEFVRRWAIDKEGNGTSAEERLSAIAFHPAITRAALKDTGNG